METNERKKKRKKEKKKKKKKKSKNNKKLKEDDDDEIINKKKRKLEKNEIMNDYNNNKNLNTTNKKMDNAINNNNYNDDNDNEEEEEEEEELVVEGIVYNDTMYLLDKRQNVVYSGIRDDDGNLVRIGSWNADDKTVIVDTTTAGTAPQLYPFPVDTADHCETPYEAYEDIDAVLKTTLHLVNNKSKHDIQLYDSYYCAGSFVEHMKNLGYSNVYNRCEDFYEKIEKKLIPEHDILITNPPYSSDHVEKLFNFISTHNKDKSCFLLLPSYFCQRKYFKSFFQKMKLFFIVPSRRYRYRAPKGGRDSDSMRKDRKNAPFISFWYCALPVNINKNDRKIIYGKIKKSIVKYNMDLQAEHDALVKQQSVIISKNNSSRIDSSSSTNNNNMKNKKGKKKKKKQQHNPISKKPRSLQFYESFNMLPNYLLSDHGSNKTSNKRRRRK